LLYCVSQAPAPPPPTAAEAESEKNLQEMFKKISGEDLEVDAYELRDILNSEFMKGIVIIVLTPPRVSKPEYTLHNMLLLLPGYLFVYSYLLQEV